MTIETKSNAKIWAEDYNGAFVTPEDSLGLEQIIDEDKDGDYVTPEDTSGVE